MIATSRAARARRFLVLGLGAALGLAVAGPGAGAARAGDAYPSRSITLIVPYPAGGANDMLGRLIGQKLSDRLRQQVIVDNRPGAGTLIGASQAARAAPDGYTLFVGGFASNAASPHLFKADYHPIDDFAPIGLFGTAPTMLITSTESPFRTLKDLVDAARRSPGTLRYGSSGNGSPLHMAGAGFCLQNGLQMIHVPYKGGSAHILDLIGRRVDVIFDTTTNATPLIRGGKVRPLAVASAERLPAFPDVPTFAESGYPGFAVNGWYALYAPARTPKPIVDRLSAELQAVLASPDVIERLREVGITPASGRRDELLAHARREYAKYRDLIRDAGIKAD
ncbi:tripartite tricarboxylate transporter substrate binding protein [Rhodoplanes sp. TEM]|uniref:Tripartite tricarboxylate transporter substrate binding protein n=1 Tax=Rhodoplanes tepidamans TaxID=200616 RepID=A0ABT5J7N1_RHOTP|nr:MULTISPECIES: tripartite tricarboxylate transporter substrate binding protein [Rhodoplanes]MDC7785030.1 tripartite tricarboxylate transporter substrate binding protein [Rhodoplanes tepidamans]MDC7982504.1 tripartite tricarboxylate transporter substrate binding protein [Rhodoplanes sp. TEM]MDQ0356518.1 tripartite-type tricarboxylate transporter receptor subunit TctC [Rhodoplanes tepidamans]